ncbi:MAG: type II toxin-antitoxin system RelE/ParE family toxin [Candidatus Dormibacteria bacterium]
MTDLMDHTNTIRPRWRHYTTSRGDSPVRTFLDTLSADDAAKVVVAMRQIRDNGLQGARHLRGDLYEVRVPISDQGIRVLFAPQGKRSTVFLALVAYSKKSQQAPSRFIDLAESRLKEWNGRGAARPARRPVSTYHGATL